MRMAKPLETSVHDHHQLSHCVVHVAASVLLYSDACARDVSLTLGATEASCGELGRTAARTSS